MGLTGYRCRLFALLMSVSTAAIASSAVAQVADPTTETSPLSNGFEQDQPLDPDKPLSDIPDFGVEWPEFEGPNEKSENAGKESISQTSEVDISNGDQANLDSPTSESDEQVERGDSSIFQPADVLATSRYQLSFSGLPVNLTEAFDSRFQMLSALEQYRGEDSNFAQIKRRADTDRELVEQLLQGDGYYDAVVQTRFAEDSRNSENISVIFEILSGPQYELAEVQLPGLGAAVETDTKMLRESYGLTAGHTINTDHIVDAQKRLQRGLAENGYPFARLDEPELVIDHAARSGDLTQSVVPGGRYKFGAISMANTQLFGPEHVQLIARFDKGELYRSSDVEDLRRALIATGLVSTVSLDPVVSSEPEHIDLAINLTPAPLRTIAGELGYGTGEGIRAEASWEHRNFFPPEGMLRLTGVVATQEQAASITLRRNNFRRRDNVLNGRVALSNIDRAAYAARTFSVGANIERQSNLIYQKRWSWSAGVELLASQERDVVGVAGTTNRETFFIGALPGTVLFDASDDLLDPTRGFRLGARISPEASLQDGSFFYVRGQIDGSGYIPVSDKIVMAARVRFGSIVGSGNNRIAPSRRLYSGGSSSVRGYGYQRIGPLDANNDPVGGRSLVEFSLEARVKTGLLGGNVGLVPFVDAGNVYTDSLPSFSNLRYGAGLGMRYYSDFGPIRIDVGTPINPQPGDSRIAVYVSLGQAF